MGSASFRNCARTQIEKSCPTLSSVDILRKVLSAHFLPALSTWIGPGCRKRSLLLSLAKQSAAASRSVINRRCRNMQLTIACSCGDGRPARPSRAQLGSCLGDGNSELDVSLKFPVPPLQYLRPESPDHRRSRPANAHPVLAGTM